MIAWLRSSLLKLVKLNLEVKITRTRLFLLSFIVDADSMNSFIASLMALSRFEFDG